MGGGRTILVTQIWVRPRGRRVRRTSCGSRPNRSGRPQGAGGNRTGRVGVTKVLDLLDHGRSHSRPPCPQGLGLGRPLLRHDTHGSVRCTNRHRKAGRHQRRTLLRLSGSTGLDRVCPAVATMPVVRRRGTGRSLRLRSSTRTRGRCRRGSHRADREVAFDALSVHTVHEHHAKQHHGQSQCTQQRTRTSAGLRYAATRPSRDHAVILTARHRPITNSPATSG